MMALPFNVVKFDLCQCIVLYSIQALAMVKQSPTVATVLIGLNKPTLYIWNISVLIISPKIASALGKPAF